MPNYLILDWTYTKNNTKKFKPLSYNDIYYFTYYKNIWGSFEW